MARGLLDYVLPKTLALHVFHHQKGFAFTLEDVIHRGDVLGGKPRGELSLPQKARAVLRVVAQTGAEPLERHLPF